MSQYAALPLVADPALRLVLKALMDRCATLEAQALTIGTVGTQPLTTPLHAGGQRINQVADPTAPQDGVTQQYLFHYVAAKLRLS